MYQTAGIRLRSRIFGGRKKAGKEIVKNTD